MSAYREQQTEFKDVKILMECLSEHFKHVEFHEKAIQLEGYHGDKRTETAEVVIPRKYVGTSSNDIGFKRTASGSYAAIISDYDSHVHGAEFMRKLKVNYTERFYKQQAAKAGLRMIQRKQADGRVQLQFVKQ